MPKITSSNTKNLFVKYALRIIISSLLSIFLFCSVFSFLLLKLDIDLSALQYIGTAICIVSSFVISYVSTLGFKNNFLVLSLISVLPLLIFSVVNFCVSKSNAVFIIVKIAGIIICSVIVSLIKSGKKLR